MCKSNYPTKSKQFGNQGGVLTPNSQTALSQIKTPPNQPSLIKNKPLHKSPNPTDLHNFKNQYFFKSIKDCHLDVKNLNRILDLNSKS